MTIYLCLVHYDHEGFRIDGMYTSLRLARKHNYTYSGDYQTVEKWTINKLGEGKMIDQDCDLTQKLRLKK